MVKRIKNFTIEESLIEQLEKCDNASKIVNQLLSEYFGNGENLKIKEIEQKVIDTEKQITELNYALRNLNLTLSEMRKKEHEIKEKFKNIPKAVIDDFAKFPSMNEESLENRYKNYWCIYKVTFEEILEAFKEFKNGK